MFQNGWAKTTLWPCRKIFINNCHFLDEFLKKKGLRDLVEDENGSNSPQPP